MQGVSTYRYSNRAPDQVDLVALHLMAKSVSSPTVVYAMTAALLARRVLDVDVSILDYVKMPFDQFTLEVEAMLAELETASKLTRMWGE